MEIISIIIKVNFTITNSFISGKILITMISIDDRSMKIVN